MMKQIDFTFVMMLQKDVKFQPLSIQEPVRDLLLTTLNFGNRSLVLISYAKIGLLSFIILILSQ